MSAGTLLLDATLATATSLLSVYVGVLTLRRPASDPAGRTALRLFGLWWIGLAAITLVGVLRTAIAWTGNLDAPTLQALSTITVLPLAAVLAGLVSYLAYIYTGSPRVFLPILVLHGALLAYLLHLTTRLEPETIALGPWGVEVDYGGQLEGATSGAILALILLPAFAAAVAYMSLYFRTSDRSARYRIAMVSGAFIFWFGSTGLAGITDLNEWTFWPPVSRGIALVSTLMVLAAYRPPRWARARYGLRSTEDHSGNERAPAAWRTAKATLVRLSARRAGRTHRVDRIGHADRIGRADRVDRVNAGSGGAGA